jgi:FkbM family methyltransferase
MKNPIREVLSKFQKKSSLQSFLIRYAKSNANPFFLQIGANDGVTGDPIHQLVKRHLWKGILVEPVPYLFEKLKKNYANLASNLIFENVAISNESEKRIIYYISDEKNELPTWAKGLNSFNKTHILWQERNFPNIGEYIKEESIDCVSLKELLNRNSVDEVNLLLIDVEGYDYDILKQLDSIPELPDVVIYEHKCLGDQKCESQQFMISKGYDIFESGGDTIAIKKQTSC